MELKAGNTVTGLGAMPEEWDAVPFSQLFSFTNGVNAAKESYGTGYRFVNVLEPITHSHLYGPEIPGRVEVTDCVAKRYSVKPGDVLFNRTSETDAELGLATVYFGTEHVIFGGFVIRGRPHDDTLEPAYSAYALRAPFIRRQIVPMGQGAVRANIGQRNLGLVVAPIPPKTEQRAIGAALSDVDALLDGLTRLIAKKRDLKQAAMQQLLTGRTRLQGFKGQWQSGYLADVVASLEAGVSVNSSDDDGQASREESGILKTSAVVGGRFLPWACKRISSRDLLRARLNPRRDTLLISRMNTVDLVGECGYVDSDYPNLFIPDRLWMATVRRDRQVVALWLSYLLSSLQMKRLIGAAATGTSGSMKNLSKQAFLSISIGIPSANEQSAIAETLRAFDAELAALEARHDKTRALKQAMMQELLTGRTRLV